MINNYRIFILILSGLPHIGLSQSSSINQLIKEVQTAGTDTGKIGKMYQLASAYLKNNIDSALWISQTAYNKSIETHYTSGIFKGYEIYGRALINSGKMDEAMLLCKKALAETEKLIERSREEEERKTLLGNKATFIKNLGICYDLKTIYPDALKYYLESLKIEEELGRQKNAAGTYHNIGGIYLDLGQYDEAKRYFMKAYQINKALKNPEWLANNLTNMAIVYCKEKEYGIALEKYRDALQLFRDQHNIMGELSCLQNMGNLFYDLKNLDSAEYYIQKAIQVNDAVNDPSTTLITEILQSNLYIDKGEYNQARINLQKLSQLVHEYQDFVRLEEYYYLLFKLDSLQGDLTHAISNLEQSYNFRDSIHNEENIRKLTQSQLNYEFNKKELVAKSEQEKKDMHQRNIRYAISFGLIGTLGFLGVVYRQRNKVTKEKKRSEELLLNILPEEVAEELKLKGGAEAKQIEEVSVLFTDFKGFTEMSEKLTPKELVEEIDYCFRAFDHIMQKYNVEKIKTIGDSYMAAGGLPIPNKTHAIDVVNAAIEIQQFMLHHKDERQAQGKLFFEIRIGIHTGPVVAGIVGVKKFAYDIWGDTVNTASRMESSGESGKINISETTYALVKDKFSCRHRGKISAKGKGEIDMYFIG